MSDNGWAWARDMERRLLEDAALRGEHIDRDGKGWTPPEFTDDDPPFMRAVWEREVRAEHDEWMAERQRKAQPRRDRAYRKEASRRARMAGAEREAVSRQEIIKRDNATCYLCGRVCSDADIHLDHIIPLAKGGSHTADNLAVACATCNVRKGTTLTTRRPSALS